MVTDPLGALSPLDGRYAAATKPVAEAFSEAALIRQRLRVEIEWLLALSHNPAIKELDPLPAAEMRSWVSDFGPDQASSVKAIEKRTNHDVKAVEYYLSEKLKAADLSKAIPFAHFAATSEDINNLAQALQMVDGLHNVWVPAAKELTDELASMSKATKNLAMLAHTHGQTATPTTLGKELAVFTSRFRKQIDAVEKIRLTGKWNGATGTLAAHSVAYPEVDWVEMSRSFVEGFGLEWMPLTTQIEPHDTLAEVFHGLVRFNSVLLDFCRDVWSYISLGYLRQQTVAGEVGSSTMPHKVNPIDFENAEANVGISSALLEHLASKLMVSRMQRDLSDSSALRNVGVAVGHSLLALRSTGRGLGKIAPGEEALSRDLDGAWEVLAEAIQTVMRRYGHPEPYEQLKKLTRGTTIEEADVRSFVKGLGLPAEAEHRLLALTPATYTGRAADLVGYLSRK